MIDESIDGTRRVTLGADKGYDVASFVEACRIRGVSPHVAQNQTARRRSSIDCRTTVHAGYTASQKVRSAASCEAGR